MKKLFFIFSFFTSNLFGQSFDGVYVGELISSKNAFIISTAGNLAIGAIQLNANEKLSFLGNWNEFVLEGKINLLNGEELLVVGRLSHDSLCIELNSSINPVSVKHKGILIRISSDPKYNLRKVFERSRPGHDERLIGKWVLVKILDNKETETASEKYTMEFRSDGWLYINSTSLNNQILSSGIHQVDPRTKWETIGSTIISRFESRMFGTVEHILTYDVNVDTLTTINSKNYKYIYIRK